VLLELFKTLANSSFFALLAAFKSLMKAEADFNVPRFEDARCALFSFTSLEN
jgi:hypothetical protein